ncbi:MAG: Rne/Rng family ribonuclease [Deltaproteobacteria bacterium]|nr:Rne/Rng family ribonuclease [Deltaproteobacteria bacterium]
MSGNLLVINVDIREVRVALIEEGIIAELHIERLAHRSTLGNVYLGKVSRVLPGMQAAFIDIGEERAAFLHVEDLIRPDDFEKYLANAREAVAEGRGTKADDTPSEAEDADAIDAAADESSSDEDPAATADDQDAAGEGGARRGRRRRRRRRRGGREGAEDAKDEVVTTAVGDAECGPHVDGPEGLAPSSVDADDDDETISLTPPPQALSDADDEEEDSDSGTLDVEESREDDDLEFASEPTDSEAGAVADPDEEAADDADGDVEDDEDDLLEDRAAAGPDDASDSDDDGPALEEDADDDAVEGEAADDPAQDKAELAAREPSWGEDGSEAVAEEAAESDGVAVAKVGGSASALEPVRVQREAHPARAARSVRTRRSASTGGAGQVTEVKARVESGPGETREPRRGRKEKKRGRDGGRAAKSTALEKTRISKSTPIREVVREGQHVIVQVTKEPIGTKGARVSSHVSLAGRYVVYLPTVEHIGISKRIGSEKERARLREVIESVKPPTGGLVVRTVAESLTKKGLKNDIGYLVRLWDEIIKARDAASKAPTELYEELDLVLKTARDLFTDDVAKIIIDNREQYGRLRRFVEMFMPERVNDIELYEGREPVFDAYGIEDEIGRALSRKVPLASGGYLIIDQAEALTAIDVNTGRFVGKGNKDLEDTILATNLEAVEEIAYQLRFRNIGGLIILDLIDMERAQNREKVRRRLEELLAKDKAKTTLNRISDLGLIEMTRKRTRESLGRLLHEPCFYCDGTGQLMSKETIAYEILRQIRREQGNLKGYKVAVNAHPAIIDLLKTEEHEAVKEAERMFMRRIDLVPRKEYHIEQFDLQGG